MCLKVLSFFSHEQTQCQFVQSMTEHEKMPGWTALAETVWMHCFGAATSQKGYQGLCSILRQGLWSVWALKLQNRDPNKLKEHFDESFSYSSSFTEVIRLSRFFLIFFPTGSLLLSVANQFETACLYTMFTG